ncbi:MAG TPA: arylsulfatase [Lacipirellulaceae bacterium]|nr:arylsulfatase [Lacipirellulaceae bacterium]
MRLTFTICCFLAATANVASAQPQRPNFLVIVADDLGFSDLGCYGSEIATPNLDSLAAGGLRYSQFYNTARCWPTRAALLTSYYAQQVGFDALPGQGGGASRRRPPWAPLLPQYLRPLGYRSYHSGKWHLDGGPIEGGFDRSYSLNDHDRYFAPQKHTLDDRPLPPVGPGSEYYATSAVADRAIEFLNEHAARHGQAPFFAYVAFTAPHFPLHARRDDIGTIKDRYQVGWDAIRAARWRKMRPLLKIPGELSALEPQIGPPYRFARAQRELGPNEVWRETPWDQLSDAQRKFQATKMSIHAAMVERMDREIGRLIEQLRDMDALENTVVFFLSDNGASAEIMIRGDRHDPAAPPGSADTFLCLGPGWSRAANTPFRRHKTWVHEGGIATPLVVHWPAGISAPGGVRDTAVGHVIDIAPTIVELAGGTWSNDHNGMPRPPSPGRSLARTFQRNVPIERESLWWLHEGNRAIRAGDWKLVAARDGPWELYNLATDRAEIHNLASKQPERAKALEQHWLETTKHFQDLAARQTAPAE